MYAGYHIESKEYDKALKEYEEITHHNKENGFIQTCSVITGTRQSLVLMNQKQEACKIYEEINHLKDSLDAQVISAR